MNLMCKIFWKQPLWGANLVGEMMKHWFKVALEDALSDCCQLDDSTMRALTRAARIIEDKDPHCFRTDDLEMAADELSQCVDLNSLSDIMWRATTSAGFQNFILFVLHSGSYGFFESRVCTSCKDNWINNYYKKGYQAIDPVINYAHRGDGIFEFSTLHNLSPVVEGFWKDSELYGVGRQGFCVVRTIDSGARIGVSFLSSASESLAKRQIRKNGYDLCMIADIAIEAFVYISHHAHARENTLSQDELRFLYMVASRNDPSKANLISPKFGSHDAMKASIRKKLGVETVYQAITLVAAKGYFDDLEYDTNDVVKSFPPLYDMGEIKLVSKDKKSDQNQ